MLDNHKSVLSSFGKEKSDDELDLPYIYLIPKMHKNPYKQQQQQQQTDMKGSGSRGGGGVNKYVLVYARHKVTLNLSNEKKLSIVYLYFR